jgi:chromate transporter
MQADPPRPPGLIAIAAVFTAIGLMSFGSGMSAWIRREVVIRRRWMDERSFLSGLALCQIAPGANGVSLAALVGTMLRGTPGMLAALLGMLVPPAALMVVLGAGLAALHDQPWLDSTLGGLGAAAIGLTLANAIGMSRSGIRSPEGFAVVVGIVLAIGVFRLPLLAVVLLALPISLAFAAWRR